MIACQYALGRHNGNGKADKRFHRLAIGADYAEHSERQSDGMAQREAGNQQKRLFARAANQQEAKNKGQMVVTGDNMLNPEPKMARKIFAKCHAAGDRAIGIGGDAVHALGGGEKYFRAFQFRVFLQREARKMHMATRQIEKSMIVNLNRFAFVKTAIARRNPHIIAMRRCAFKAACQATA